MITIDNITILQNEINKKDSNLGFIRTKLSNSNEEYTIGKTKNFYQVNIRSKTPLYKLTLELFVDYNKYLDLLNLFESQMSEKLFNFMPNDDIITKLLYSYTNKSTRKTNCFIDNLELLDSYIFNEKIVYKCKLELIEC